MLATLLCLSIVAWQESEFGGVQEFFGILVYQHNCSEAELINFSHHENIGMCAGKNQTYPMLLVKSYVPAQYATMVVITNKGSIGPVVCSPSSGVRRGRGCAHPPAVRGEISSYLGLSSAHCF